MYGTFFYYWMWYNTSDEQFRAIVCLRAKGSTNTQILKGLDLLPGWNFTIYYAT